MSLLSARFPNLYIQQTKLSDRIAPFGSPGERISTLAFASLLYGIFCVVYASLIYILLWSEGFKSRARFMVFVVTTVMFCAATAHWAVLLAFTWILETRLFGGNGIVAPQDVRLLVRMDDFLSYTPAINVLFSDGIVLWRAWLIYGHRSGVLILSASLLVPALVSAVGSQYPVHLNANTSLSIFAAIVFGFLTTAVNVLSTALISWKAWQHRRAIRNHLKLVHRRTQVERILALLVESGFLYSAASVRPFATVVSFRSNIRQKHTQLACAILITTRPGTLINCTIPFTIQSAGIYPTIIVVLASLKKTHCDCNFTYDGTGSPEFASYHVSMRQTSQNEAEIVDLSVFEGSRKQPDSESDKSDS
ncbi:hypothetical protein DENSPDRAFT_450038 [Dentipellis sp. KUC8613]|nr:hypothetical protein DENSPDRAFT_450038 [Dentipellis sp. KUC8613]